MKGYAGTIVGKELTVGMFPVIYLLLCSVYLSSCCLSSSSELCICSYADEVRYSALPDLWLLFFLN
jgi:hypothetical protein